jgi:cellulose biosynthesis protein BcsQ
MSVPVVAFFNNKGGVGKTTMVYHLSWMFAELGTRVLAVDLDPQANLTAAFLDEDRLESLSGFGGVPQTIFGAIRPLKRGTGDAANPHVEEISDRLSLILGDMSLSTFEDSLSEVWPKCLDRDERAFRITSAFWRVAQQAGQSRQVDLILVDVGPNLGAINRSALIAADYVVIPIGADLFSLQGLQNLGPAIQRWREEWSERLPKNPMSDVELPAGGIKPIGYVILRHSIRLDRPVKSFEKWIARIPSTYEEFVLRQEDVAGLTVETDPNCIARLKDYRSLMPMAQEVRKPIFLLKPADGALGAHMYAVSEAYKDFKKVAFRIARDCGLRMQA